jgi:hypothetical protein
MPIHLKKWRSIMEIQTVILTPLLLAIRSFWLMAKDETRSQVQMRAQETGVNISVRVRGHADDQSSTIKE